MKRPLTAATSFALLMCAGLASPARAQTIHYDVGFEPPTFQLGALAGTTFSNGQDGWLATGDSSSDPILSQIVVQAAVAKSGARAVSIDATGQPTPYAHIRRNTFFDIPPTQPLLDIAFDLRITQAATTPSEWGIQAQSGPGPGSGILEWWIDVVGQLHVTGASGQVATGVVLNRDQWYRVVTRVDYVAQTCSVSIDGQVAATVVALSGAAHWYHAFTSLMFIQPGDDRMYVDNFSLVTHDGSATPTTYCTAGTSTHGCAASLSASGTPSASASSGFTVSASSLEGAVNATYFYGINGPIAWPWAATSTSFMCVKSPRERVGVSDTGGALGACDGTLSLDFLAYMASHPTALGQPLTAGQRFNVQAWYRDPPAAKSTNLSNALEFTLVP